MFDIQMNPNPVQRTVCMLLAAFIVSTSLASGMLGLQALERSASVELVKHA